METRQAAVEAGGREAGAAPPRYAPGRGLAWLLAVGGALGLVASFALTVERIVLALNPGYVPSCDLNPVVGCGSVMTSEQAALLGFPNPLLGLVGFSVVTTLGVLTLARVPLPRFVWAGLVAGTAVGFAFVQFLVFSSLFRIGALCPYCMVVWAVTVPLFVTTTTWALTSGALGSAAARSSVSRGLHTWRGALVAAWFAAVVALALLQFWDYWSSLL